MKIKIEEEIYEGAPAEIMEQLWERSFDYELFSDLDKYMDYLGETFERVTEQPCDTLVGTTDERAHMLILRLADIDALEVLKNE